MWVQVGGFFYNTDHIISMVKHEDAGVYYIIRFSDGTETGLNPNQIQPLVDAITRLAEEAKNGTERTTAKLEAAPPAAHIGERKEEGKTI